MGLGNGAAGRLGAIWGIEANLAEVEWGEWVGAFVCGRFCEVPFHLLYRMDVKLLATIPCHDFVGYD